MNNQLEVINGVSPVFRELVREKPILSLAMMGITVGGIIACAAYTKQPVNISWGEFSIKFN
ncbi:hypothetical protein [Alkalicoccus saliphilus]|uniref:hypothetical protein n=1 Tax=Alkalicoccus saliphilus TaxID=200989 RepID=UPI0011B1D965|nr:hypothetical protein [Alkalicoccus saliphilus]